MPQHIEVPGHGLVEFPDEMSEEQIVSAIHSNMSPEQSHLSQLANTLGSGVKFNEAMFPSFLAGLTGLPGGKKAARQVGQQLGEGEFPSALGEFSGESLPFIAGGEVAALGKAPAFIERLAQGLGKWQGRGLKLAGISGKNAAFGAGQAGLQPEQGELGERMTQGGLVGGLIGTTLPLIAKGLNWLRPSHLLRGSLSPEQLTENLRITKGTGTGLGDVIDSPFLKKQLENVLPNVPLTGADKAMQETGKQVVKRGEELLSNMLTEEPPEKIAETAHQSLLGNFLKHQETKNTFYNKTNAIADKANLQLQLPNFAKKATDYADAIEATNMLKYEPDVNKVFNKLKNYKTPIKEERIQGSLVDKFGQPLIDETKVTTPTLKEANLLKGKLNYYSKLASQSPDPAQRHMAKVFGDLGSSLKSDIETTIDNSNHPELKSSYKEAEENYAKNFSGFLDKDIYKFIGGKANPEELISKFIKTSSTKELSKSIEQLLHLMPGEKEKNLITYAYFSRALDNEGNLNPAKLGTLVKKLGPNQLKALVPDVAKRQSLLDYSKLQKMNKEAQYLMFNPKTGARNTSALVAALAGHAGSALTGASLGGIPGAIGGLVLPGMAGKYAVKTLTSQPFRESLVNAMIENKPGYQAPGAVIGGANQMGKKKRKK